MKKILATIAMLGAFTGSLGADDKETWQQLVDMKRADMSLFSMTMINEGSAVGSMSYGWQREGNTYVVSDRTEMQPNILETARAVIDARSLLPLSNDIDFAVGTSRNVFDVEWKNGALAGGVQMTKEGAEPRDVDFGNPEHPKSALRLSIFGLIAGMPLDEGFSVDLPWYNTLSNSIENITLAHVGKETVVTPAGAFEAHKIHIQNGTPENMVYVTTALPQKIVRIDVLGQPMHFERLP